MISEAKFKSRSELTSIQVLRGIAASLVVFHHSARAFTVNWPADAPKPIAVVFSSDRLIAAGAVGVDIFFVISGFIMVYVAQPYLDRLKPPSDFLLRRIIRIYPMYALATTAVLVLTFVKFIRHFSPGAEVPFSPERIFAALLFIPTFDADGNVQPILGVGWTLFYEMFFYVCFASVLSLSRDWLVTSLAAIFVVVISLSWAVGGQGAVSVFFKDTIMLEFLLGCIIGTLFRRSAVTEKYAAFLLASSVLLFVFASLFTFPNAIRFLTWGVPSALLVTGFLQLEIGRAVSWPPALVLLGEASYSIYLVHVICIYELRDALRKVVSLTELPADLSIVTVVLFAIAAGMLAHRLLERPVTNSLNEFYGRRQLKAATE